MRHLLSVIVTASVLVAVVTGCDGLRRYDARLVAADSLMHDWPDSALALVEAVAPDSLTREGDRAYRDLLLTQGRYRSYVTATSDSDINRALDYYRRHEGEREKLTRAYIYKGAVMEELGLPDTAMIYYKYAEATAAPDDYFNLGYTNLRIAELYQGQFTKDSSAIVRLNKALNCFSILNDTNYQIICYEDLGAVCGLRYPDSTEYYLKSAIELSQQFNPSMQYTSKSKLAGFNLYYKHNYNEAKNLAMDILVNGYNKSEELSFYYYATLAYIKLGLIDSANYIKRLTPAPSNAIDSMLSYDVMAELSIQKKQHVAYGEAESMNKKLSTRFIRNLNEEELIGVERDFEKQVALKKQMKAHRLYGVTGLLMTSFLLVLLGIWIYHQSTKIKRHQLQLSRVENELKSTLIDLKEQQNAFELESKSVSEIVSYRISALNELYHDLRVKMSEDGERVKRIVPLSSLFKSLNDENKLLQVNLSDSFWHKLKISVDGEYNGIVTYVENKYPNLTVDELRLFILICADISPQIIKLCLNYTNAKTVSNYRSKLIKKRMGLDMSFDDFKRKFLDGELP